MMYDVASTTVAAWREQSRRANNLPNRFDYIVCGAGPAGSVTAARLSEDPHATVLLIEAGGRDDDAIITDPNRWPQTLGTALDWNFLTEPNAQLAGRTIPYNMGRALGGGSSINVATWSRGHQSDWDGIASSTGDAAWSYSEVLALYRDRIEAWAGPADSQYRGADGTVHVQPAADTGPFAAAVLDAAVSTGLPLFPNANGAMMEASEGCAFVDEIIRDGKRPSLFTSYVAPVLERKNLTVITKASVGRVVTEKGRAVAVIVRHGGRELLLSATREIVLALGAVNTPKLLMLSGFGPRAHLTSFGIPVVRHLPGVGRGLHDHVAFGCVFEATQAPIPPIPRSQTAMFWRSHSTLDSPDCYAYARRGPAVTPENASRATIPSNTWSLMVGMRPHSRGSITLRSNDADEAPRIDTGYLSDDRDLENLVSAVRTARAIGGDAALRPFTSDEVLPGPLDDAGLHGFLQRGLGTFWHQSGSARMGNDDMSVVDSRLRVHDVDGLRVADASALPFVTTGNTMAPCVVVGEQVARFMRR